MCHCASLKQDFYVRICKQISKPNPSFKLNKILTIKMRVKHLLQKQTKKNMHCNVLKVAENKFYEKITKKLLLPIEVKFFLVLRWSIN